MTRTRLIAAALVLAAAVLGGADPARAQDGAKKPPYLGVGIEQGAPRPTIAQVAPGSPGEAMGVKVGDVIVEANGSPIATVADLQKAFADKVAGDDVSFKLERAGAIVEVAGKLGEQPTPEPPPSVVGEKAKPWVVERWGNLPAGQKEGPSLESLRGKVVVLHCFQAW